MGTFHEQSRYRPGLYPRALPCRRGAQTLLHKIGQTPLLQGHLPFRRALLCRGAGGDGYGTHLTGHIGHGLFQVSRNFVQALLNLVP